MFIFCDAFKLPSKETEEIFQFMDTFYKSLKTCPAVGTMIKDPKALSVELMPHQKYALLWLLWRENQKPSGGILGMYRIIYVYYIACCSIARILGQRNCAFAT